jgi:hypothetical protein
MPLNAYLFRKTIYLKSSSYLMKKSYVLAAILGLVFLFGTASQAYAATPAQRIQLMKYHLCLGNFTIGPVNRAAACAGLLPKI